MDKNIFYTLSIIRVYMNFIEHIKIRWNAPKCPECGQARYCVQCGSYNVREEGWRDYNHRHLCLDCGHREYV